MADAVLGLHFAIAAFIVLGLPAVWAGAWLGWAWVRNRTFRWLHLGAILIVALEALAGIACPLTILEDALRGATQDRSFIGRWVAWLLYYDAPPWAFTILYAVFALLTVATWLLIPPSRPVNREPRLASRSRPTC